MGWLQLGWIQVGETKLQVIEYHFCATTASDKAAIPKFAKSNKPEASGNKVRGKLRRILPWSW
jgi:hypothetical protein